MQHQSKFIQDYILSFLNVAFIYGVFLYKWFYFRDSQDYNYLVLNLHAKSDFIATVRSTLGYSDILYSFYLLMLSYANKIINELILCILPGIALLNYLISKRLKDCYYSNKPFFVISLLITLCFYPAIVSLELRRLGFALLVFLLAFKFKRFKLLIASISFTIHPTVILLWPLLFPRLSFAKIKFQIFSFFETLGVKRFVLITLLALMGFFLVFRNQIPILFNTTFYKFQLYSSVISLSSPVGYLFAAIILIVPIFLFKFNASNYLSLLQFGVAIFIFGPSRINILIFFYFLFQDSTCTRLKSISYKRFVLLLMFIGILKSLVDLPLDPCTLHPGGGCGVIPQLR